ncbi:maleylacetoacetate isomerase isoform X1 [Rhipicephalus microplus]|uniref:maleylacetoacetate isomerase isoform X1 n=1 Tax=Rhipicephalus microplus TaxID=6941 RepID=UPI003F6B583F
MARSHWSCLTHISRCPWSIPADFAVYDTVLAPSLNSTAVKNVATSLQTAKFKTFNPMGQVPVLLVDGKPISQSVAIMEYLEEQYPKPAMLPMDPYLKAKCREVVELLVSGVHPLQSPSMIPFLGRTEWKEWAHRSISRGFAALEATLAETAGRYCFGDEVTFADACLLPQVHNAERIGVDVTPFPTVRRICEALRQHPLVKEADPSCQPDTPPTGVPNTFDLFRDPKNQ